MQVLSPTSYNDGEIPTENVFLMTTTGIKIWQAGMKREATAVRFAYLHNQTLEDRHAPGGIRTG